ncbi:permease [Patescibacteria group bacterium]|nr:permease [Patescibacteria group bacterium]
MNQVALHSITKKSAKQIVIILPIFFIAIFIGVLIENYLPGELIKRVLGEKSFFAIPIAAIIGIIFPIPRYVTYPIAFALVSSGAGLGVAFALISGEVISESIVRDVMEIKLFGFRFFSVRLLLSTIGIIAGGYIMEAIL